MTADDDHGLVELRRIRRWVERRWAPALAAIRPRLAEAVAPHPNARDPRAVPVGALWADPGLMGGMPVTVLYVAEPGALTRDAAEAAALRLAQLSHLAPFATIALVVGEPDDDDAVPLDLIEEPEAGALVGRFLAALRRWRWHPTLIRRLESNTLMALAMACDWPEADLPDVKDGGDGDDAAPPGVPPGVAVH
jgi:hypothetical protein